MSNYKFPVTDPFSLSRNTNVNFNYVWDPSDKNWAPQNKSTSNNAASTSAFGEPLSVKISPVIQLDGIYGFDEKKFDQFTSLGGSVSFDNSLMKVSTGTSSYGYGVLRSKRAVRYRPGQGALCRFTAKFSQGVDGYIQRAGFFNQEQALQIGMKDEDFGIFLQNGGKAHIVKLTLNSAASGSETITITLNGIQNVISISDTTLQENILSLKNHNYLGGWIVSQIDNTLIFLSNSLGPKTGSYSFETSLGGSASGSFQQLQLGVDNSETFIKQSDFNIDKLDGKGESGMIINTMKLNVFQINFRWLGAGEIRFAIENPSNGDLIFFHHIHWANQNIIPHLDNPSMKIGYVAASLGGSGANVSVEGASFMGAIEGEIQTTSLPISAFYSRSSPDIPKDVNTHLLSLKNRAVNSDKINQRELIIKNISIAATAVAATPAFIYLYFDPFGETLITSNDLYFVSNGSFSSLSTTQTTMISGLKPIAVFAITTASSQTIDLSELRIVVPPQSKICFSISAPAAIKTAEISVNYIED